jgi:heme exporter protein C
MQQTNGKSSFTLAAWKWACIAILIYVFVAGWIVPLNPGIIQVTPSKAVAGTQVNLKVEGYNSAFQSAGGEIRAWLRLTGDTVIQASKVLVADDRNLRCCFLHTLCFSCKTRRLSNGPGAGP